MGSAWVDLFEGGSNNPIDRIECEEPVEKDFLPELVKGLSLLTAWYNRRYELDDKTGVEVTDWEMVSYDNSYGDWSMTALHKDIPDHYFIVEYDLEERESTITQYKRVVEETLSDEDLDGDNEIASLTESGKTMNVIDITERLPNGE